MKMEDSIERLIRSRDKIYRKYTFRASSLPFCGIRMILDRVYDEQDINPGNNRNFISDFYMEVGTAIHTVVQRWLGRMGVLFGYWKCDNKICDQYEKIIGPQFNEPKCSSCNERMLYEEFTLKHKSGFSGHCDGLINIRNLPEGEFDLLEVKSCSSAVLKDILSGKKKIRFEYVWQVSAYKYLIPKMLGYKIHRVLFIFVPRDNPRATAGFWYDPKNSKTLFLSSVADYKTAKAGLKTNDFSDNVGICKKKGDVDCPFSVLCFSDNRDNLFTETCESAGRKVKKLPIFPGD